MIVASVQIMPTASPQQIIQLLQHLGEPDCIIADLIGTLTRTQGEHLQIMLHDTGFVTYHIHTTSTPHRHERRPS